MTLLLSRIIEQQDSVFVLCVCVFVMKVLCNILAADGVNDPDVLAINGGTDNTACVL